MEVLTPLVLKEPREEEGERDPPQEPHSICPSSVRVGRLRRGRGTGLRPAPSPSWTSDPSRSLADREGRAEAKEKSKEGRLELRSHSTVRMRTKLEFSSAQKHLFFAFFSFFPLFLLSAAWGKKNLSL